MPGSLIAASLGKRPSTSYIEGSEITVRPTTKREEARLLGVTADLKTGM
jgi:hypothetical protein